MEIEHSPDADEILIAAQEALARSGGAEIVYLHDGEGGLLGAIVRVDSPAWERLVTVDEMPNHDHIEPGMF